MSTSPESTLKTYDTAGRVEYEVDGLGYVTAYQRDAFGEATSVTRYATATTRRRDGAIERAQRRARPGGGTVARRVAKSDRSRPATTSSAARPR